MTFLPIVERELRVRSRQAATHWLRAGLAFVAGQLALQSFLYSYGATNPTRIGQGVFLSLAWTAQIIALASIILTADCLSAERRGGTLGLLFLTDLKGYDVVLGKLASSGLGAFYALLGMVPALAIPILAGGVTGGEVTRYALAVLNTLFVSLALGLWVSSRNREQMPALRRAAKWLLVLWLAPMVFQGMTSMLGAGLSPVALLSPQCAFNLAAAAKYRTQAQGFWLALLVVQMEGWVFLWAGSRSVVSSGRETGSADAAIPGAPVTATRFGDEEVVPSRQFLGLPLTPKDAAALQQRDARAHARRERDPLRWLAEQLPGQRALLWVGALLALLPWGNMLVGRIIGFGAGPFTMMNAAQQVFYFGSRALFAWAACRLFLELRRSGALELLLSTPRGARELVPAHWRVLGQQLRGPLLIMVLLQVSPWLLMTPWRGWSGVTLGAQVSQLLMTPVNNVLEILAVCRVGLWLGLAARRPASAVAWTVILVVGLPWMVVTGGWMLAGLARSGPFTASRGAGLELWMVFSLILSPGLLLLKNLFFLAWAGRKLEGDLRNATGQMPAVDVFQKGQFREAVRRFLAPA